MARLQLSLVVSLISLLLFASGVFSQSIFTIVNNCTYPIWPGGPGQLSNPGAPQLPTTGFLLNPNYYTDVPIPAYWSGNLWGRTLCSTDPYTGQFTCVIADCGSGTIECNGGGGNPPDMLAEFTLNATRLDYYDISLVNGFNVPMNVVPQDGTWTATGCSADINAEYPVELQVISNGEVVACMSACVAFGAPCTVVLGPTRRLPHAGQLLFRSCLRAPVHKRIASYAFDTGTLACAPTTYTITFCP